MQDGLAVVALASDKVKLASPHDKWVSIQHWSFKRIWDSRMNAWLAEAWILYVQIQTEADRLGRRADDLDAKTSSLARELEQRTSDLNSQLQASQQETQQVSAQPLPDFT